ncbi:MAG: carboxypeptidase-like regulatory domain-containing protein, partial [Gemmatimonadales bacterium]
MSPAAVALGLSLAAARGGIAQVLELRLRDDSTRAPLVGAIVRLIRDDATLLQGLTDETGRISLRAPGAGLYRLRIDRIGWSGTLTSPLALAADETLRRELFLSSTRMTLPTLEAHGETVCAVQGREGSLAAALWEEIRKALTANYLTLSQGTIPIRIQTFERQVALTGLVQDEWVTGSGVVRTQPFGALPPELLAKRGFVFEANGSMTFAGPDAVLLLSDQFVQTHCFHAVSGADELVGLAFEPVPRRKVPDVRGTLWVSRATSELQFL